MSIFYRPVLEYHFIDEGRKIPLGMKFWEHKHVVPQDKGQVIIEDRMEYSMGNKKAIQKIFQ